MDRTVIAYRHSVGKRATMKDNEIVCPPCHTEGDREIVLRSHNGQLIKTGNIPCAACGARYSILGEWKVGK